jgi:hypothetical protein
MNIIELAKQAGFERVVSEHPDGSVTKTVAPIAELETFARLVIEEHLKGVDMEPVGFQWLDTANFRKRLPDDALPSDWRVLYTATQMAAQRHNALEEATLACESEWLTVQERLYGRSFAAAIRALKEKT